MPLLALQGAICSGHGCFPPRASIASNNQTVFVEGRAVHILGDPWPAHQCGNNIHAGNVASGSLSVFIGGRSVARLGDGIAGGASGPCGSLIIGNCAKTVFCGG